MKPRYFVIPAIVLFQLLVFWLFLRSNEAGKQITRNERLAAKELARRGKIAATPSPTAEPSPTPELIRDPSIHLGRARQLITDFHSLMGENPTGTNAEIMSALDGGNPRQARLLSSELGPLNSRGELIDTWGQPYFFHQLSKDVMEIRSAGPDHNLWTSDDLLLR